MAGFVGRERERELLRARLADARGGRGQLVLVSGEPGIGKTRLVRQLADQAQDGGLPVAWGRASEDEGSPPYWIFRQLLRSLGQTLPEALSGGAAYESPESRFEAFECLAEQLRQLAEPGGLVAVLDDLQWADAASLGLLAHVARGMARSRLMLVATYRDTEATGRVLLAKTLSGLAHESGLSRLRLVGLTAAEVALQLAAVTGSEVSPDQARRISRRTGGNPFFVTELGLLAGRAGLDAVPEAVLDAVRARLAQLREPCRELVATAAVVGSELDPAALAEISERPLTDVLTALDEAAAAGIVQALDGWRFCHDLIRESARLDVPTAARLTAHARMAGWLEGRPDADARTSEIAHHWLASLPVGDARRAADWAERAADEALRRLAWERAAELYRSARSAGAALDAGRRSRLLRREGVALLRSGDTTAAATTLAEAAAAADEAGDPVALGKVALEIEGFSDAWLQFRGGSMAAEALGRLPDDDDPLRARLLALQAGEAAFGGGAEPERMSAEALAMAERLADGAALRSALRARQMVRSGPDGVHERLGLGDRMLTLGTQDGDDDAALWGRLWRFDALVMLGRLDDAEAELSSVHSLAERLHRPLARWHWLRSKATIDIARGRFDDAARATQESLAIVAGRAHDSLQGVPITVLTVISSLTGRRDLVTDEMFELFHRSAPRFTNAILALYLLRHGDRERAEAYYRASGSPEEIPAPARLSMTSTQVELAAALDHPDDAARAAAQLRPHADLFATGGAGALLVKGSVRSYLGIAAAAAGRLDDAVRELRLGVAANARANTPPFTAVAEFELAAALCRRRRPGDLDEASALAASAGAAAGRLGMAPLQRDADALIRTLSGDQPGPLTPRERQVADQVAKGLTNRQIAALLHISERTAESHVQHVLTKLGLTNRTQVAARLTAEQMRPGRPAPDPR